MDQEGQIKKLKEISEKLKAEKEEVLWKENHELIEKNLLIEKLKIETEDLKKMKKQEEISNKKSKTSKKNLETLEEEKEKKKKTLIKNVEKELVDKEQAFLEELEELKVLMEFIE